jgi:D-glycero-D-manno-heptose 1,7-bisphosphate phosphatase
MTNLNKKVLGRMKELKVVPESDPDKVIDEREPPNGSNKAIFLDRDGVIIEHGHPQSMDDRPEMIPRSPEAIQGFREMGYKIAILTNQGASGMGVIDHDILLDVMDYIANGSGIEDPWDLAYYCPYHDESIIPYYRRTHPDRKPEPGMLFRAARDLDIDLDSSIMIGDHLKDVEVGHRAGCRSILLQTGRGKKQIKKMIDHDIRKGDPRYPDDIVSDLITAYELIKGEFQ